MIEEDSYDARESAKNSKIVEKLNEILKDRPHLKKMPHDIQWAIAEKRLKKDGNER